MKSITFYCWLTLSFISAGFAPFGAFAQREGYNWTMGDSLALSYQPNGDSLKLGYSTVPTYMNFAFSFFNASISDSSGNLLFYIRGEKNRKASLIDKNHEVLEAGAGLFGENTKNNTAQIIPLPYEKDKYLVISGCEVCDNGQMLNAGYYHIVDLGANNGKGEIVIKNNLLISNVRNHIASMKHANGRDWWLLFYEMNSNRYARILVDSLIHQPEYQSIGGINNSCFPSSFGNFSFSTTGEHLINFTNCPYVIKFDFDRCTGLLSNLEDLVPSGNPILITKFDSLATMGVYARNPSIYYLIGQKKIFQINLYDTDINSKYKVIAEYPFDIPNIILNQFVKAKISANNKLIIGNSIQVGSSVFQGYKTDYLAVINHPDKIGDACGFDSLGIYTGRFCSGMPNMPNFSLKAFGTAYVTPYPDYPTTICPNDSVALGAGFAEKGITYQWAPALGLSCTDCPNPKASPAQTTTYTLTTTNANPCGIASDAKSVTVTVKTCGVSRNEANQLAPLFKLYPNPTQNRLTVSYPVKDSQPAEMQLFDALGRSAGTYQLPPNGELEIDTSRLNPGSYECLFIVGGRETAVRKLVVQR